MSFIIHESAVSSAISNIHKTPLGTIKFIAVLQEADRPNRNRRIYPKNVLEPAVASSNYINERLRTNGLFGEAGHPLDQNIARQCSINHANISHIIHRLWWEGNLLMGEVETANTATGRDMAGLIEQGYIPAFSLRAQGGVHQDISTGCAVVEPGIQILTWDWVINPSHDKAFMQSICNESKEALFGSANPTMQVLAESANVFDNGAIMEVKEEMKEPITENYILGYNKALRHKNEIYFYDQNDKIINESVSADYKVCELQNANVTKKVVLEDFLAKDIRNGIEALTEGTDISNISATLSEQNAMHIDNTNVSTAGGHGDRTFNGKARLKAEEKEHEKTALSMTQDKEGHRKYYIGKDEVSEEAYNTKKAENEKNSFKFNPGK